ncbi:MAG: flagellar basal body L-ring protein FlgH [Verrucomicrobiota bacterium]
MSASHLYGESLWLKKSNRESSMFADPTASAVGDLITIQVDESTSSTSSQSSSTSKDSQVDNAVTQWLFPLAASSFGTHNGALPGTSFGGSNTFNGSGSTSNTQAVSARATVSVIDRLPNGNLVIEGARRVTFSGESQWVVLKGIVRKADIRADNSVLSSRIGDASVEFISSGALTEAQRKGWLTRIYDTVNPN